MSSAPPETKAALRQRIRATLREFPVAQQAEASARMRELLCNQAEWKGAGAILLYAPLPGEPNLWPLLEEGLKAGRRMALPRFAAEQGGYEVCLLPDLSRLRPGAYGIPEPGPECPVWPLNQLDLSLVPGIAFTLDGGRLGRGKGYYDRLLAAVPGFKCGVAFDCQVAEALPLEPHDVQLNCILTPTRWQPVVRPPRS